MHHTLDAKTYNDIFVRNVVLRFGLPDIIVSDRGSIFTAQLTKNVAAAFGVELRFTSAYRPQANGLTELQHQRMLIYLRSIVSYDQHDWAERVAYSQFALNTTVQPSLEGRSP